MNKKEKSVFINVHLCSRCTRYEECPIDYECKFYSVVSEIVEDLCYDYSDFGVDKA